MPEDSADRLVTQLQSDYTGADLEPLDRALLDYSAKLTRKPAEINPQDVSRLRELGLDDRGIHDLCAIVAYFAFANRIANGLGIELENDDPGLPSS